MRFAVQGRVREQDQHSLPNLDRGMGKYQRSVSTGNMIIHLFIYFALHQPCILHFFSFMVHNTG